jgi:hypothetical protein
MKCQGSGLGREAAESILFRQGVCSSEFTGSRYVGAREGGGRGGIFGQGR